MQLILNAETDIGIQRKMSAIEQESFEEKLINKTLAEKVDDEIPSIKVDRTQKDIVENCDKNGDVDTNDSVAKDDENITSENCSEINSKDKIVKSDDAQIDMPDKCDKETNNEPSDVKIKIENVSEETISDQNTEAPEEQEEKQTEEQSKEIENECKSLNGDKEKSEEKIIDDNSRNISDENVSKELDTSVQESNDEDVKMEIPVEKESENSKEASPDTVENGDVISIPDEKEEESKSMIDQEMTDIEKQTEKSNTENNQSTDISSDKEIDVENKKEISIEEAIEPEIKPQSPAQETVSDSNEVKLPDEVVKETIEISNKSEQYNNKTEEKDNKPSSILKETKKLSLICKLSNTLDILSDEEEETAEKESQSEPSTEKQCINIDDDDDIMLIDEETEQKQETKENVTDDKNISENSTEAKIEDQESKSPITSTVDIEPVEEKEKLDVSKDSANIIETEKEDEKKSKEEEKSTESKPIQKPLLPVNFLKTCKKNLADMTRDELEEFCILKIVESVVDRSNLSEIKTQLKTMGQSIEEYKKKAFMLTKQNRDLQVVLKSVQEEQKKRSDLPITPLKITRSVGMQVFMTDKTAVRRKPSLPLNNTQNNVNANNSPNRLNKSQTNQSPKLQKPQINVNNSQQIPVPRLVPAVNNANNNKTPSPNIAPKPPVNANIPNGIRNSPPIQKPEKRPHSKMQGNSVTVDLTDDEPPTKVLQRNVNPPVRLVSQQNLLASPRQPFATNINSPRKVYIPISGSQNQVRPGQTIMLKPVNPPGTRPRLPSILPKTGGPTNSVRMTRINARHPAPLPDSMKQYQPPNWKSLPPAPELKLSKVENGIVISWKIDGYQEDNHEEIASYQLYAYQETSSPPSTALWKKIGDVKALPLPMACTLTQFMAGYKYYFAVRAVDIRSRLGPFSAPGSILLLNKM